MAVGAVPRAVAVTAIAAGVADCVSIVGSAAVLPAVSGHSPRVPSAAAGINEELPEAVSMPRHLRDSQGCIVVGLVCGAVLYLKALSVYYIKYGVRLVGILLKPLKMLVSVIRIVLQSLRKDRPKNGEI